MRRTEVLQGLRAMRFEDIHRRWQQRRLSQAATAAILGMSERTFRRWTSQLAPLQASVVAPPISR
jgi:hypothetical protein